MPKPDPEVERELTLSFKISTFGTRAQARATAEKVRRMLTVELHQEVQLTRVAYKAVER